MFLIAPSDRRPSLGSVAVLYERAPDGGSAASRQVGGDAELAVWLDGS